MQKSLNNPKVSVIIACFSQMECSKSYRFPYFAYHEPIKGAIESVKSQDYDNIELILADKKDDKGAGAIRREAIERATGDIIYFIDSDVILIKDTISKLIEVFNKTNADVIISTTIPNRKLCPALFTHVLTFEYEKRELDMGEGPVIAGATSYLGIRKEVLDKVGYPLTSATIKTGNNYFDTGFADWDFCGELNEKGYKIWHTKKVLVHHFYQTGPVSYFIKQFYQAWYRWAFWRRFKKVKEG